MPGITRNCYGFLARIIAQISGKLFNFGAEFSSFKTETHDLQDPRTSK